MQADYTRAQKLSIISGHKQKMMLQSGHIRTNAYQENFLAYLVRQGVRAMRRERTDVAEMQRRLEALEARLNSGEHK